MAAKKKSATVKTRPAAPAVLEHVAAVPLESAPVEMPAPTPARTVKPIKPEKPAKHTKLPAAAANSPACTKKLFSADECHCFRCSKARLT